MAGKVKSISIAPSRTLDLGSGNGFGKLQASVEMEFDTPVEANSGEVKQAFENARKLCKKEMAEQYKPFAKYFTKK